MGLPCTNNPISMGKLHPLKTRSADNDHVGYDKSDASFSVAIPLCNREDGHAAGTAHISGETLLRAFGQPNADLLHVNKINVTGATTSSGCSYGGHFHTGESGSENAAVIESHRRVHHVEGDRNATVAAHFIVPPGNEGCQTTITPPKGLGAIDFEPNPEQRAQTSTALGRELRWGKEMEKDQKDLARDCQEVTSQGHGGDGCAKSRFLVPVDVTDDSCAMSKLVAANKTNASFCGGQYHEDSRKTVMVDGKKMVVMDPDHFKDVSDTLKRNLKTHNPLKDGLTINVQSHCPTEVEDGQKMHVYADVFRTPTATVFGEEHVEGQTITKADAHKLLGEDLSAAMAATPATTASKLAQEVFAVALGNGNGPSAASFTQSSVKQADIAEAPAEPKVEAVPPADSE